MRKIGAIGGRHLKVVAIYDICREALDPLKKRIAFSLSQSKSFESGKSSENKAEETDVALSTNLAHVLSKKLTQLNLDAESESFFSEDSSKEKRGGISSASKFSSNYFSIHGAVAGGLVDAKSQLAVEVF